MKIQQRITNVFRKLKQTNYLFSDISFKQDWKKKKKNIDMSHHKTYGFMV